MAQTKAQLIAVLNRQNDDLITAGREIEQLRLQLAIYTTPRSSMQRRTSDAAQRPVVPVYEWDPRIDGDFARALKLAKENNGRCIRARIGH